MDKVSESLTSEKLGKISKFARRELSADEIYVFPVVLCDNEIDRDGERFSISALKKLSELFIGKTGIFDHNPKSLNQTARIFDTEVVSDSSKKTAAGEAYTYLRAEAYMVRTDKNADLIREIDAGIKKEVSVGCTVGKRLCSVCGKDVCLHKKGRVYNGKMCHTVLEDPTDAYEWSFVAVPAQKNAGVVKKLGAVSENDGETVIKTEELREKDDIIFALSEELREDVERLCKMSADETTRKIAGIISDRLDIKELIALKHELSDINAASKAALSADYTPQLPNLIKTVCADKNNGYKL